MSRIGKQPIEIPSGVQVAIKSGLVSVQGPAGKLDFKLGQGVAVSQTDGKLQVEITGRDKQARANYGTTRSLLSNMVQGANKAWTRTLELHGVGYNAALSGQALTVNVGLSHKVVIDLPKEMSCKVAKTTINLECADKQVLGNIAAKIRKVRPPEPYLGKGVRYSDEVVRRKAGKTGK